MSVSEYWTRQSQRRMAGPGNAMYDSPQMLWENCCEYFKWVETHPLIEDKVFCSKGIIVREPIEKMRAMTSAGMCLHIGVSRRDWVAFGTKPKFDEVVEHVEAIIFEQKFTGAAAELLNPNMIIRDLGLSDKQSIEANVAAVEMTDDQLNARLKELMDAKSNES